VYAKRRLFYISIIKVDSAERACTDRRLLLYRKVGNGPAQSQSFLFLIKVCVRGEKAFALFAVGSKQNRRNKRNGSELLSRFLVKEFLFFIISHREGVKNPDAKIKLAKQERSKTWSETKLE
jgi:hypothetical protein